MGYTSTTAQLFTVPPNMTGFVVVILTAHFSDKVKNRGYFIVGGTIVGICGYIMLLASDANPVKYAGTFLIAAGVFQASPMLMVSPSESVLQLYRKLTRYYRAGSQTTYHLTMSGPSV